MPAPNTPLPDGTPDDAMIALCEAYHTAVTAYTIVTRPDVANRLSPADYDVLDGVVFNHYRACLLDVCAARATGLPGLHAQWTVVADALGDVIRGAVKEEEARVIDQMTAGFVAVMGEGV